MDIFEIIDWTTSSREDVDLLFIASILNIERPLICSIQCINMIHGHLLTKREAQCSYSVVTGL